MSIFTKPSFYALAITGVISFIVLFIIIANFSKMSKLGPNKLVAVLSLAGSVIGIHGLLHLGMETSYNYNPIEILSRI